MNLNYPVILIFSVLYPLILPILNVDLSESNLTLDCANRYLVVFLPNIRPKIPYIFVFFEYMVEYLPNIQIIVPFFMSIFNIW